MEQHRVDFGSIGWQIPLQGARFKAFKRDHRQLRLVEFTTDFMEPDWCRKSHIGYVLEGEMDLCFDHETVRFSAGDGLFVPEGDEHRHRATMVTDVVKLILVEDA